MTADEKAAYSRRFPVHVGVDTAKHVHVLVARGPDGRRHPAYRVPVSRRGFEATDSHLQRLFPGISRRQMLVGLEGAAHYALTFAHFLAANDYPVVSVLPAHTKRVKELEDNSPLKTDAKDAALICKLVGDGTFVRYPFLASPYVELRVLAAYRHRLAVDTSRCKVRLQALLDVAWPELLAAFSALDKQTPRAILERWPLPPDFLAAARRTVCTHVRTASRGKITAAHVAALTAATRQTIGLPQASAERRLELQHLLARWALLREHTATVDTQLATLIEPLPAAQALLSLPEVDTVCAATLLAELGAPNDFQHPRQILKLAGMNLVERSSGGHHGRRKQSKRGRPLLRRQLFLLAGRWCLRRGLYRADYEALLARNGGQRTKAVCAVARKLVPLLLALIRSGQPFDPVRWAANRCRPSGAST